MRVTTEKAAFKYLLPGLKKTWSGIVTQHAKKGIKQTAKTQSAKSRMLHSTRLNHLHKAVASLGVFH